MDLGRVSACENYGDIASTDGGYVGGIAGASWGTIRDSWVKCHLSGGDYIGGVAGLGEDSKVGTGQLPINTPGGVAGLGADGKMDTDQLPINVPNGIPTLGADGKLSADSLPQVGMTAQIVVTAPTGSTVTATLGTKVYTATESGGKWTFDVEDYGTYTIKATKNGQTATDTVTVSVVQQYTDAILLHSDHPREH